MLMIYFSVLSSVSCPHSFLGLRVRISLGQPHTESETSVDSEWARLILLQKIQGGPSWLVGRMVVVARRASFVFLNFWVNTT